MKWTFTWLTAHRRLARDDERRTTHPEAMIYWAMIGIMIRRLDRAHPTTQGRGKVATSRR